METFQVLHHHNKFITQHHLHFQQPWQLLGIPPSNIMMEQLYKTGSDKHTTPWLST
jgi:hypothetical protein